MPIMNGIEASQMIMQVYLKLKATPEYSHIPIPKIFAVTAHTALFTRQIAENSDILAVIEKPVNKKILAQ